MQKRAEGGNIFGCGRGLSVCWQLPPQLLLLEKERQIHLHHLSCLDPETGQRLRANSQSLRSNHSLNQLIDFRWVPLEEILNPNSLQNYTELKLNIFNRMGWQKTIADRVRPYFIHASLPALDVRMQRPLWGVTLWIVSYFLQMAAHNLGGRDLSELNSTISFLKTINVQFKPGFPLAMPLRWVVSGWHNAYRVKPFSYPKRSNNQYWIMAAILCLILYVGAQLLA